MGLDMYLTKTKRVKELQVEDYAAANNALPWSVEEYDKEGGLKKLCPEIEGIEQLDEVVYLKGENFKYMTIKQEVGYWRKANHIHNWFVEKCQDGIDECQLTEVTKEQLEDLLETCYKVINKKENPENALPTASGFFFGGTNYDQYYYDDIKNTIKILEETINKTDWDKEIVFYQSYW